MVGLYAGERVSAIVLGVCYQCCVLCIIFVLVNGRGQRGYSVL